MRFGPISVRVAEGAILAHAVTVGSRTWRKATVLTADDVIDMLAAGLKQVIAASLDAGDFDENAAATLIAAALYGPGVEARPASTGRVNLHASQAGVFIVKRTAVDAINGVDAAITLATLDEYSTVSAGQMIATVKIIPFAVSGDLARKAAEIAARHDVLSLRPFRARRIGLVQTVLETIKPSVLDKTSRLTDERLSLTGNQISRELRTAHEPAALADTIAELCREHELVIIFGASAVSDVADVIPSAIRQAGGEVLRVGMPVDPGNLLVIGKVGSTTVIGAPGCARSPKLNGFDWVLSRTLADIEIGDREIAGMGVGGLLMEIESRPQPREPKPRRALFVDGVLLAAGRGQRMGGPNKLLARFGDKPLVRQVAQTLAASTIRSTMVVVGHQAPRIVEALVGVNCGIVENEHYATGLASSLKKGVAALRPDAAGVLVALADMPGIGARDLDRMVDAFVRSGGRAIVRATHAGKRGNPVLLPRSLFAEVASLSGDTGARHLVEGSDLAVIEVEIGDAASVDVDTPDAMAQAGGVLVD